MGKPFGEHWASYKKRDHYNKDLEEKMREIPKQELLGFFIQQQVSAGPSEENAIYLVVLDRFFQTCYLPRTVSSRLQVPLVLLQMPGILLMTL
jgi:hypothetical protein